MIDKKDYFYFDSIKDNNIALKDDFWYYIDDINAKVMFKSNFEFEWLEYKKYLKFTGKNHIYITDTLGKLLLTTTKNNLNSDLEKNHLNSVCENFDVEKNIIPECFNKYFYNIREVISWDKNKYYKVESVNNKGFVGVVDEWGKSIIDFRYDCLYDFIYEGKLYFGAMDSKTKLYGVIDIDENIIIPFIYNEFADWNIDNDEQILFFEKDGKWGAVDINGKNLIDFKYKYILGFINQYSMVQNFDEKWGLINRKGKITKLNFSKVKTLCFNSK